MAKIQELIHLIETGRWAKGIRIAALGAFCFFVAFLLTFDPFYRGYFKGISHRKGMEQAAVAKQIASGNGFASAVIRPLSLAQMKENKKEVSENAHRDTYLAPAWPAVLSPAMFLFKSKWEIGLKDSVYLLDRVVAGVSYIFFFLGVWISYFTIRRLFDAKMGMKAICLTLLAGVYWRYASSGLPQLWLFFLFACTLYSFLRAIEAEQGNRSPNLWLAAGGLGLGGMTLSLATCAPLLFGAMLYFGLASRRRGQALSILAGTYLICVIPWVVRNWMISGSPFGIGFYSSYIGVYGDEGNIMRRMSLQGFSYSLMTFRSKMHLGIEEVFASLYPSVGGCLPALVFFLSFLHRFRNPVVLSGRWLILCLWLGAVIGMAFSGLHETGIVRENDITLLFIPIFAALGMAFLMVLWGRLEIASPFYRRGFIVAVFVLSAIPLLNIFLSNDKNSFTAPYHPRSIGRLSQGAKPEEIIASDMPWAVAWYANRVSFLFPLEPGVLTELHDYNALKRPFAGVFLTALSADTPFLSGIFSPEYRGWYPLLRRDPEARALPALKSFPFPELYVSEINSFDCFYTEKSRVEAMRLPTRE